MKSHESSYTEELRSIISTTHPLQQSKAVAVSNGGLTMEREVHEGMWKLPRYERNLHIYSITVKGKLLFIMVVSLKYIFFLENPGNQLSVYECSHMVLRWWWFCSGLLRLLCCCREALSSLDCLETRWSPQTQPAKCWDGSQEPLN